MQSDGREHQVWHSRRLCERNAQETLNGAGGGAPHSSLVELDSRIALAGSHGSVNEPGVKESGEKECGEEHCVSRVRVVVVVAVAVVGAEWAVSWCFIPAASASTMSAGATDIGCHGGAPERSV